VREALTVIVASESSHVDTTRTWRSVERNINSGTLRACERSSEVRPALIPDYLALVGDSMDGYPVTGIGAKGAARLLARYDRIEDLSPQVLSERRELALLFKELAILRTDVPVFRDIDELKWRGPEKFPRCCERLVTLSSCWYAMLR
jgi:5'-3' exonuclease